MTTKAIFILLAAFTLAVDLHAAVLPDTVDADKDGGISLAETENFFLAHDGDKDGEVTKEEFAAAVDKIDPAFVGHEAFLFAIFDSNANGSISKADLDAAFKIADLNKNGFIDKSELVLLETLTQLSGVIVG